ncbi:MAG: hypothetical protein ACFE0J_18200 [Elainellaceae cyanobacterium]
MTHDVRQWLTEIKTLQQKLSEVQKERDEAFASAAKWRSLYETEARQRRADAHQAQQMIQHLKTEFQSSQLPPVNAPTDPALTDSSIHQQVKTLQADELEAKLIEALVERDRLSHDLQSERDAHERTRKNLTSALGDTVDLLTKERAVRVLQSDTAQPISTQANL